MSKKTLSLTLVFVMTLAMLCAATFFTACEPPKDAASGASKAGDYFDLDKQNSAKKTPAPTPTQKAAGSAQNPPEIIAGNNRKEIDPNIRPATPAPATPAPATPQPDHKEGSCWCGKTHRHHKTSGGTCWCGADHQNVGLQHIPDIENCYCIKDYGW